MNEITPILAALIVIVHLAVIFWPRKPLAGPKDANGMPLVWLNQEERKDVACVWPSATAAAETPVEEPALTRKSA